MTIKQINKIRNFGVFDKFMWNTKTPAFNDFNLTYGWNYCGKTTLSRVFRCFELGEIHSDYLNALFEIEDHSGIKHTEKNISSKYKIRVFNSDFIYDNLKWNEGIEPILMLGEQNIKLQEDLECHKDILVNQFENLERKQQRKTDLEDKMFSFLKNKASEIKNTLTLTNFDKRHLESEVNQVKKNETTKLLLPKSIKALIDNYKASEKKSEVNFINLKLPNVSKLIKECNHLLSIIVTAKVIERLKNNTELNEWVRQGKLLHKGKEKCEFCNSELPSDLLKTLNNHFSKDYDELLSSLDKKVEEINSLLVAYTFIDAANFYTEYQEPYNELKNKLQKEIDRVNNFLKKASVRLTNKKINVFTESTPLLFKENSHLISTLLKGVKAIITNHNLQSSQFEKSKRVAYKKLILNYALEFSRTNRYDDVQQEILTFEEEIQEIKVNIKETEKRILDIEEKLSETVKGAEKINEYLSQYFGKEDLKAIVTNENKFQLFRAGKIAKNLSEGEKTAIAFAYYITKLEDKHTKISETIIYLDDPISSLDSNHLFNTYSFIKTKFYDDATRTLKCKQLFISTHNFEFFSLIKDWFNKVKDKKKSFYIIERVSNGESNESKILPLPQLLVSFKSEYCYLFSLIYSFKLHPSKNFNQLYSLPNIIRRFLESFTAFKYLSSKNVDENLDQLIIDDVKCERVRKFIHYYSHSLSTSRVLLFSDMKECSAVVDIVLESIQNIDLDHYNSLLSEVPLGEILETEDE